MKKDQDIIEFPEGALPNQFNLTTGRRVHRQAQRINSGLRPNRGSFGKLRDPRRVERKIKDRHLVDPASETVIVGIALRPNSNHSIKGIQGFSSACLGNLDPVHPDLPVSFGIPLEDKVLPLVEIDNSSNGKALGTSTASRLVEVDSAITPGCVCLETALTSGRGRGVNPEGTRIAHLGIVLPETHGHRVVIIGCIKPGSRACNRISPVVDTPEIERLPLPEVTIACRRQNRRTLQGKVGTIPGLVL